MAAPTSLRREASAPSPLSFFCRDSARCHPDPVGVAPWASGPLATAATAAAGEAAPPAIVIDNGSFRCRAGWSCEALPRLAFKNVVAKNRGQRSKAGDWDTQVGNDISNIEVVRWLLKTQFDRNVVVNFEVQEQILDHVFLRLGVQSEGRVDHSVVLTEPVCNPACSRALMSELLFECYSVPRLCLGVDALFSCQREVPTLAGGGGASALVVSAGYHSTHVLPVLNGRLDARRCKRINVGGAHAAAFLQRLLQLKYPGLLAAATLSRAEELLHRHGYVALDYAEELERWHCPEYYHAQVRRYQLPVPGRVAAAAASAAAAATAAGTVGLEERQRQRRLLEGDHRKRRGGGGGGAGRLQLLQQRLERLMAVQALRARGEEERFVRALRELKMESALELRGAIARLHANVAELTRGGGGGGGGGDGGGDGGGGGGGAEPDIDVVSTGGQRSRCKEEDEEEDDDDDDSDDEELSDLEQLMGDQEPEPDKLPNLIQQQQPQLQLAELYQMHVGLERVRATEVVFQPSLIGEDSAGLAETIAFVLSRFSSEEQHALVQNVIITGGNAQYPGLCERLHREMVEMRPFNSTFSVRVASEPALSAWLGARLWAVAHAVCGEGGGGGGEGWMTRADYAEKGSDYLAEHSASNVYVKPARPAAPLT